MSGAFDRGLLLFSREQTSRRTVVTTRPRLRARAAAAPSNSMTALSHSHSVAAAESGSGCHRRPHMGTTVDDGHDVPREPI